LLFENYTLKLCVEFNYGPHIYLYDVSYNLYSPTCSHVEVVTTTVLLLPNYCIQLICLVRHNFNKTKCHTNLRIFSIYLFIITTKDVEKLKKKHIIQ